MKKLIRFCLALSVLCVLLPNKIVAQNSVLAGPEFGAFLERIDKAEASERQAIADSFITAQTAFPVIESDTIATYIYTGNVNSVHVPGDANGWSSTAFAMTKVPNTTLWYRVEYFEADARLDYKFVLNGSSWMLDPRNNQKVSGGFGPNSELRMPDYKFPTEINYRSDIPHGTVKDTTVTSSVLNNSRKVSIYFPPGYDASSADTYPMMMFHDGSEFVGLANAVNVLDNLIHEERIEPIIGVFIPPVDRNNEYAWDKTSAFETFITTELLPVLVDRYSVSELAAERGMIGASYAGLITAQIVYNNPELFGNAATLSTAFWAKNQTVYNHIVTGIKNEVNWYIDWGTYEGSGVLNYSRTFANMLDEKGYVFKSNEWHDGHSWGNWRAHIDEAVEFFFPKKDATNTEVFETETPRQISLSQNYPNPFNPTTNIQFTLPIDTEVRVDVYSAIGSRVVTLINERKTAGTHTVTFHAKALPSGLYIYKIRAGGLTESKKMMLVK